MARGRGGRGQQRPVRGFRPGKEPPQIRKQRAREQLGDDANWAQRRLVDALADRTPEQSRAMMRRWRLSLLVMTVVLVALGAALYMWSLVAGIIVHLLAVVVFLFWLRLHRQQKDFEMIADLVSGGRRK
jgi:Flp pilus assembly protein TadB